MFSSYAKRENIRFTPLWTGRDQDLHINVIVVDDEYGNSPVETVQAFLREYALLVGGQSDIAARWGSLFGIPQAIERAHQSRLEPKIVEELLVLGGIDYTAMPHVQYVTRFLSHRDVGEKTGIDETVARGSSYPASSKSIIDIWAKSRNGLAYFASLWKSNRDTVEKTHAREAALIKSNTFIPSKSLTDIWVKSLNKLGYEAGNKDVGKVSEEEIRQKFSKTLIDVLGTLAQQLRYEGETGQITQNNEFTSRVQIELCDTFLILPSMSTAFVALLRKELINSVRSGWKFRGPWGYLDVTSIGDLKFQLTQPEFAKDPMFVRARRVE